MTDLYNDLGKDYKPSDQALKNLSDVLDDTSKSKFTYSETSKP